MAEKFVRSTRGVRDIEKLSTNLIEETDIVSTEDGKLFIKGKNEYIEIGGSSEESTDPRVDQLLKDVEEMKTLNKNLMDKIDDLSTEIGATDARVQDLMPKVSTLTSTTVDHETRITALETSQDTPTE